MTDTTTRALLDDLAETAHRDTQAAARRAAAQERSCTELRVLIAATVADLAVTVVDVRKLVDSRRPGVSIGGSTPKGATTPAPVNVAALSLLEERDQYLTDVVARLTAQLVLTGVCWIGGPHLLDLVELIDDPARLRPAHRDLERLAEQAHRVVDGLRRLPDPCPHCRRNTLTVDHDTGLTTCGKDPKTGRRHPCTCEDRYCPCTRDRTYRHTWSRAARAHTPTSWQGLSRAQEGALVLEASIDRVRDLHTKTPVQPWATDCLHHDHEREHLPDWDIAICVTCPPAGHVCRHCHDLTTHDAAGNTGPATWPCPTIRALDDLHTPAEPAAAPEPDPGPS